MAAADGARRFDVSGDAYDAFMGRYSRRLAVAFADWTGVRAGHVALDVGSGPGALTGELVTRLGSQSVCAVDPSPPFVEACAARHPGVDVRLAPAESIPFADASFDRAMAQLVLHFVTDPSAAAAELRRVLRAGGVASACVWDFDGGMEMLRRFWDAALALDPKAPDESQVMRFGRAGEIAELLRSAGFEDVRESTLSVESTYAGFDELWASIVGGVGPVGAYCMSLPEDRRAALREELFRRVGAPAGSFGLRATARCAAGTAPG